MRSATDIQCITESLTLRSAAPAGDVGPGILVAVAAAEVPPVLAPALAFSLLRKRSSAGVQ